jgi:hypothetical protein
VARASPALTPTIATIIGVLSWHDHIQDTSLRRQMPARRSATQSDTDCARLWAGSWQGRGAYSVARLKGFSPHLAPRLSPGGVGRKAGHSRVLCGFMKNRAFLDEVNCRIFK